MAAAPPLPKPGTEYGPCEEACEHSDCLAMLRTATELCLHCNEPIGYESRWFDMTPLEEPVPKIYAHAVCVFKDAERHNV